MRETSSPPIETCFMPSPARRRAMTTARGRRRSAAGARRVSPRPGVGAGDEPERWLLRLGDRQQSLGELDGVAALLPVLALPEIALRCVALGVVRDRRLGVVRRLLREQLG